MLHSVKTLLHEWLEDNNLIEQPLAILIACKNKTCYLLQQSSRRYQFQNNFGQGMQQSNGNIYT